MLDGAKALRQQRCRNHKVWNVLGHLAVRWAAVTFRETEKHYRRITGYDQDGRALDETRKVG